MEKNRKKASRKKGTVKRKTASGRPAVRRKKSSFSGKTAAQKRKKREEGIPMSNEISLIASFGILLIMMFSNFGYCGTIGKGLSSFFFGIFGCAQYVMPVAFFLAVTILIANDYSTLAIKKCTAGFLLLMVISAFAQLCYKAEADIHDLFSLAIRNHGTGGIIGGGIGLILKKGFGNVGAMVILCCVFLLALVLITQRSFVSFFQKIISALKKAGRAWKERLANRKIKPDTIGLEEPELDADGYDKEDSVRSRLKKSGHKKVSDKQRARQCEEKMKELESREKEGRKEEVPKPENGKESKVNVPLFTSSDEVKRKDSVRELHPKIYPFTEEDGKSEPFQGKLVFDAFSFQNENDSVDPFSLPNENDDVDPFSLPNENDEVDTFSFPNENNDPDTFSLPKENDVVDAISLPEEEDSVDVVVSESKPSVGYVYPPLSLLNKEKQEISPNHERHLKEMAEKLPKILESFGVKVTITDISCGPTVTRYEMFPAQGTKVSKIVSLADDIKLNLAAADIRIEAPIPGKAAIGIEVPNKHNMTVHFRELIDSRIFRNFKSKLAFAVGKDIAGKTVVTDLAKMPHLLIAGATGSGKSVCINTLIMSILYKATPEEVKLIMIDPKMVELSVYKGIPHLLIPVVTDPKKASGALNWAVAEMTDRYQKFTKAEVRNIEGYNQKIKEGAIPAPNEGEPLQTMPQIVIIIDELADLMMVAPGEVEDAIVRLSQLARAAGIHLVIATQRPSVNVITGLIKANVPSRIAFAVSSGVDSRTIIDMNGAEKLLGKGDMLFYPSGYQKPVRVQGAFVSDQEISNVVQFLKENEETAFYDKDVEEKIEKKLINHLTEKDRDEYFEAAARFIMEKDKATIGMLQRMFKIGFNRAARIIDQLADAGIVGPEEGTKPRKILMTPEELEEFFKK